MNNETTIINEVLQGNRNQYRQLVERYKPGLLIHCEQIVGDRALAEDITQETFVKAYTHLASYNAKKAAFSTWLYRIASNLAIDTLRRNKRIVPLDESILHEQPADTDEQLSEHDIARIRKAVDDLQPPQHAAAIRAYFWQHKTYAQIAKEQGTNVNTVGVWINRTK